MSAVPAHAVPTAGRDGVRPVRLRAVPGAVRRERSASVLRGKGAEGHAGPAERPLPAHRHVPRRPERRAASPRGAAGARPLAPGPRSRRRVGAPVLPTGSRSEPGLLLLPLGEVLVPVGHPPALRLVPGVLDLSADGWGRATGPTARPAAATQPVVGSARRRAARPEPGHRARAASRPPRSGTRRSRGLLVAALVLLLVVGAARAAVGGASGPVPAAGLPTAQRVVVVQQGQTLWSLARELAPGADPRVMVERIRSVNGLDGAGLAVGQRLVVPPAQ